MTAHYQEMVSRYNKCPTGDSRLIAIDKLDGFAKNILKALNSYEGRNRTGDLYVRVIFDCLLIYYIDKFGHIEESRAIEKIFIWAYSLRLKMQVVQLASIDNYVLENNLFKIIKEAIHPVDFINYTLTGLKKKDKRSTKTEELEKLFREMKYYE